MAVKIRLQRRGRKKYPFYHIIIADSRSPRDGKFIKNIGTYDPTTIPATIKINKDQALDWLQKGAQPSPTVHKILSFKGVLYHKHLLRGVKMNVISQDVADQKWVQWEEKHQNDIMDARTKARTGVKKKKPKKTEGETPAVAETPKVEAPAAETPVEETKVETPVAETPAEETKVETPVAETPAEETPAAETPTEEPPVS